MTDFDEEYSEDSGLRATPVKPVLKGEFTISNLSVPYFQANMTLEEVSRHLRLVEDMPADEGHKWTIEELFQRDIDWGRVEEDIVVNYLRRSDKRTFFNALTVALLPLREGGSLASAYEPVQGEFPEEAPFNVEGFDARQFGGVQLASKNWDSGAIQYLRWDEGSIFAAAIDGQHRLAALKKFFQEGSLTQQQHKTKVPVIFIVLHEDVGFRFSSVLEETTDNPILLAVREIFIDLNKHSKEVSQARQILLDDLELEARCTRTLLASQTQEDSTSEIPLGLVNWKDSSVKFDTGPYFTSITGLYLVVKDLISLKYPSDPLDQDDVEKFVLSVDDKLFMSREIALESGELAHTYAGKRPIMEVVRENFDRENPDPFRNLPFAYANAAVDGFARAYKPLVFAIFNRFAPYAQFWELSRSLGGVEGEYATYRSLNEKGRRKLEENWSDEEFERFVTDVDRQLSEYKIGKWPFMVVWQKALLKATVELSFHADLFLADTAESFMDVWIRFLDELYSKGIFSTDCKLNPGKESEGEYWEGVAKNPLSLTIRYSNSAANKTSELLRLLWYARCSGEDSVVNFIEKLEAPSSSSEFPAGRALMRSILKSQRSVAVQRFGADPDDLDVIEAMCKSRFQKMIERAIFE